MGDWDDAVMAGVDDELGVGLPADALDFKAFLMEVPDLEGLDIRRDASPTRSVDLE